MHAACPVAIGTTPVKITKKNHFNLTINLLNFYIRSQSLINTVSKNCCRKNAVGKYQQRQIRCQPNEYLSNKSDNSHSSGGVIRSHLALSARLNYIQQGNYDPAGPNLIQLRINVQSTADTFSSVY